MPAKKGGKSRKGTKKATGPRKAKGSVPSLKQLGGQILVQAVRRSDGTRVPGHYVIKGKHYKYFKGTKTQVGQGHAYMTKGGLTAGDIRTVKRNGSIHYVRKGLSDQAKKRFEARVKLAKSLANKTNLTEKEKKLVKWFTKWEENKARGIGKRGKKGAKKTAKRGKSTRKLKQAAQEEAVAAIRRRRYRAYI